MSYCYFIAASWGEGAVPDQFKALAKRLVERGHRVVYVPHGKDISITEGNFHVRSFPSRRPTKPRDFIFLHGLVRRYHPDCMISNFGAVNVMTIVGWLHRVPCRVTWYRTLSTQNELDSTDSLWKDKLHQCRKRLVYQLATHVIANSEETRRDAIDAFGIKRSKAYVFYNSTADVLNFFDDSVDRHDRVIVCPGRLDPTKGQDVVIQALAHLKSLGIEPEVRFIGAGRLLDAYQALAEELGVSDQCTFVGAIPHAQMFREMASAAFTIVPSRSEAFGLVNVESMSVGTPVIASAVGGIPEILRDGVDGFLVSPDDPEVLADKIKLLYMDQTMRQQMGQNARQRFLDVFEQRANVEKQAQWFEEICGRR